MADLIRALDVPCRVDFVRLASYGCGIRQLGRDPDRQGSGDADCRTRCSHRGGYRRYRPHPFPSGEDTAEAAAGLASGFAPFSTSGRGDGSPSRRTMWAFPSRTVSWSDMDLIITKNSVFFRMFVCLRTSCEKEGHMIIQCRKCETRFRFDENLMEGDGVWVRCSRCQHVFFQERTPAISPQRNRRSPP